MEAIVRSVPETVRAAKLAGAGLVLLFGLLCGAGAALLR